MPKGKRLTAQQIMDNYKPGDMLPTQQPEQFWTERLAQARTTKISNDKTLYQDLAERGQQKPILLTQGDALYTKPTIIDGHHRLALMHHINPQQFVKYRHRRED